MTQFTDPHQLDAEVKARKRACAFGLVAAFSAIGLMSLWPQQPTQVAATDSAAILAPAFAMVHKGVILILVSIGVLGFAHSAWSCLKLILLASTNSRE